MKLRAIIEYESMNIEASVAVRHMAVHPGVHIKVVKVGSPKPRLKWYVYINNEIDWSFTGGLSKSRALKLVKQYKSYWKARPHLKDVPVYTISTVKG